MHRHSRWVLATALGFVVMIGEMPSSHTPISSRWNYNEHLFPIFRDQCGACHIDGGAAPMSLVTYRDAFPWTQSIREEILGLRMPPWQAEDGFGTFRNGHALGATEMDMILEWSSGGYPQGPRDQVPPVPEVSTDWSLGQPDLELELPEAYTIDANTSEVIRYFVLPPGTGEDKWITAADFQPGARAVVRSAAIFIDSTGVARTLDAGGSGLGFPQPEAGEFPVAPPVAVWIPGREPVLKVGMGYSLPQGADVVLRIRYKKTWITEGQEFSDKSRVGLYFSKADATPIASLLVTSPDTVSGRKVTFSYDIGQDVRLLALLPEVDIASSEMQVEAVRPDGSRVPMLWLREPDTDWPTRFWFDAPVSLPAGSQLEVTTILRPGAERSPTASLLGPDARTPIRFAVEYVTGSATAN